MLKFHGSDLPFLERSPGDFHGSIGTGSDRDDNRANFIENTAASNGEDLVGARLAEVEAKASLVAIEREERRVLPFGRHDARR